ncbi:MAG: c-type cytochrome domain-containing protein [Bacteroidia bacterium]
MRPEYRLLSKHDPSLLQGNCASSNCHDANDPEDGVQLTDYANILATAEVQPGDPSDSKLFEVLIDSDPDDRMPPAGQPQLSQAQIDLVYTWIAQGAQNNVCNSANCDTSAVTYANTIAPLMQNKCVGCHSGSNPGGKCAVDQLCHGCRGRTVGTVTRLSRAGGSVQSDAQRRKRVARM